MKNILIVSPGTLPIPAVKGGAVESIIENIVNQNEIYKKLKITVATIYDKKNGNFSFEFTTFFKVKDSHIINFFDKIIFLFIRIFFHKKKTLSYRHIFKRFRYLKKTSRFLRKNDFDLVVLENNFSEYLIFKDKKNLKKYKNKIIYHAHNIPTTYKAFIKEISFTKRILGVSSYCCNECAKIFDSYQIKLEYFVLRNAVDQNKFNINFLDIDNVKEKLKIPKNKIIVLFTGRMTKEKGIFSLINAFQNVNDNCHLLIVGDYFFGDKMPNKESKQIKLLLDKINGKFSFTGFISYEEMNKIYKCADIVVIPSIWDDPAPLTIIEALSCGKPIITTDSGGIPEYVDDKCAVILERKDNNLFEKELSISINSLANNYEKRIKMSNAALIAAHDLNLKRYYNEFIKMIKLEEN